MKKVIALLLTIAVLCSVTACSKEEAKSENNKETKKTTATTKDDKESTSKKDNESESTKVVADAEIGTSVNEKDTTVNREDETTSKTDATTGKTESDTKAPATQSTILAEPATEPTTTKPVQVPTEPTTTKPSHTHNWQPVYKTVVVTEAWDEPVYKDMPVYETIRMHGHVCDMCTHLEFVVTDIYGNTGINLDAAYQHWLSVDGVGYYGDGSFRDFYTETGTLGYACNNGYATTNIITGYAPQIVSYTHHDAVTEMYVDYYYCADNSCEATKEGEK